MLMAVPLTHDHCESLTSLCDKYRLGTRRPPTLQTNQPNSPTWTASPPQSCCCPHPPSRFIIITQRVTDTDLTVLRMIQRWLSSPGHCTVP